MCLRIPVTLVSLRFFIGSLRLAACSEALARNFAMRHVLFGDLDLNNPGNVIFTNLSRLTSETLLNIDGEDILPDERNMAHFFDS